MKGDHRDFQLETGFQKFIPEAALRKTVKATVRKNNRSWVDFPDFL